MSIMYAILGSADTEKTESCFVWCICLIDFAYAFFKKKEWRTTQWNTLDCFFKKAINKQHNETHKQ